MTLLAVEPRLRLDVGLSDLVAGAAACLRPGDAGAAERAVLAEWGCENGIATFSVRSAFDVLLGALDLRPGDEAVFSAVTHPDMPRIARAHGLVVVPADLDPDTLAPTAEALARAIGPRTRLVVVAHLFGTRADLAPVVQQASATGALVVEDCAQVLRGPHDHGDAEADVSLFSFGAIKTATALGGALVRVRDPALLEAMRRAQTVLPLQARRHQLAKLAKFGGLVALGHPVPYGLLLRIVAAVGRDPDAFVNGLVKAFPRGSADVTEREVTEALLLRIRRRPSAPLLTLVLRRLRRFPARRLARRAEVGESVTASLPAALAHPGRLAPLRTHWVVPVTTPDPDALVVTLREHGFDAARGTSSITVIDPPAGRADVEPHAAREMMRRVVFVPVPPELSAHRRARLAEALRLGAEGEATAFRPVSHTPREA